MLDAAGGGSSSASKMAPELSRQEQEQQHPESEGTHECSVAEAPPRSPDRNGQHAKITCDKVEGDKRLKYIVLRPNAFRCLRLVSRRYVWI